MNIQRYKFPVIIAASLHGALFLHSSHPPVVVSDPVAEVNPVKPPEPIIEFSEPTPVEGAEASRAGAESTPKELPDVPTKLPDKVVFTVPLVDNPHAKKHDDSLMEHRGLPVGPKIGSVDATGISGIDVTKLDRLPRATAQISPDYPSSMKQQNVAGSVVVEFFVNTEGRVIRADLVSCTRREFAEPALRAVRNWRFEPGKRNGRLVQFRMTVPIEFGLGAD